jgi:hypothetical protein
MDENHHNPTDGNSHKIKYLRRLQPVTCTVRLSRLLQGYFHHYADPEQERQARCETRVLDRFPRWNAGLRSIARFVVF